MKKLEIYQHESKTSRLTITNNRVTIKFSKRYIDFDFSDFVNCCNEYFNNIDYSLRGKIVLSNKILKSFVYNKNPDYGYNILYNIETKEFFVNGVNL